MYINYEILTAKTLSLYELGVLQLIKQNRTDDLSEKIQFETDNTDILSKFETLGYIEYIKPKKKSDNTYKCVRTTSKGNEALDDIFTAIVTEGDLAMRDYLIQMYLSHEDDERVVGNKKLIGQYCSILRNHLNLTLHEFFYLCEYFLAEYHFTKKLENIFLDRNKNRYARFENNIEDSPLFQFYDTKKQEVENYWKSKIKE